MYFGNAHYIYLYILGPATYINSVLCAIGVYFVNPIIARIIRVAKTSIFIAQGIPVMLLPTIDQKVAQMKRFEVKMYYSFGWGSKLRKLAHTQPSARVRQGEVDQARAIYIYTSPRAAYIYISPGPSTISVSYTHLTLPTILLV